MQVASPKRLESDPQSMATPGPTPHRLPHIDSAVDPKDSEKSTPKKLTSPFKKPQSANETVVSRTSLVEVKILFLKPIRQRSRIPTTASRNTRAVSLSYTAFLNS
jgi:hypothetical protein